MTTTTMNQTQNISNKSIHELFDLQDEINKIKHYYEVQQELTHTIAIVLYCLNIQSTDPLHHNLRIPHQKYEQILYQNSSVPAPLSFFLFQSTHQFEIHDRFIQKIQETKEIQNKEEFMDHFFYEIFHSPQIPPLFQQEQTYRTLEKYLQPLYEYYY